eukprot:CAMPEP_0169125350 /NCGR_PEP_ID=MMETSP1015-20121227/34832_1 /TAXON_ID=342587 /ORGANISM="Karlodinium micrum, Strain CCMP2283" /LENGTH=100 /DNA_ID=CAMNT_0009188869 /DNA_START=396 /DNA_END=694 /DNA_ORIENTATION=-
MIVCVIAAFLSTVNLCPPLADLSNYWDIHAFETSIFIYLQVPVKLFACDASGHANKTIWQCHGILSVVVQAWRTTAVTMPSHMESKIILQTSLAYRLETT